MKRVASVKKGILLILLGLIGSVLLILLGRYVFSLHEVIGFEWYTVTRTLGACMIQIGRLAIFVILGAGIITIFTGSRVRDIPEYSELLNGVSENRKLQRKMNRALLYYDRGKYDKAVGKLSKLVSKASDGKEKCSVYTLMGMCYADSNNHEKAIETYTKALENDSSTPSLWEKLGTQQNMAGLHSEAVESWLREAELCSGERPFTDIAQVYLNEKNYESAIEYAEKALEINERSGEAYKVLCLAFYALGDKENCLKNYNLCNTYGKSTEELKEAEKWLGKEKYDPYAEYLN